jgi:hypothetical protein
LHELHQRQFPPADLPPAAGVLPLFVPILRAPTAGVSQFINTLEPTITYSLCSAYVQVGMAQNYKWIGWVNTKII